jgi:hypothetical protein
MDPKEGIFISLHIFLRHIEQTNERIKLTVIGRNTLLVNSRIFIPTSFC